MKIELEPGKARIHVVFDNVPFNSSYRTGFGFGCYILGDKNILFDTGTDSPTLENNLQVSNLPKPEILVLSHDHYDHTGGMDAVLRPNLTVYVASGFSDSTKSKIRDSGVHLIEITQAKNITSQIASTGQLQGPPSEQALIVSTSKGLVVITGCAHPGVDNLAKKSKEVTGKDIYLVMGGFHLGGASEGKIMEIINNLKELGVQKVAPSHCTGDFAREIFKREFGDNFIESGVGKVIEID